MSAQTPDGSEPIQWPFRPLALLSLQRYFGHSGFRPGQEAALAAIMAGQDLLAVMPTGSGKSLCYQLPACLRPGLVLVVSPLIALMKDQVDRLCARGLPAVHLSSALTARESKSTETQIARGKVSLAYVSPEKLRSRRVRELLRQAGVWLVAVDEAHCISTWGHDFRPPYRLIGEALEELGRPTVAAFTATAADRTRAEIVEHLGMREPVVVTLGYDRSELYFEVRYAEDDAAKLDILAGAIPATPGSLIVYCGTRRLAEMVADFVKAMLGVAAEPYHAGMAAGERTRVQEAFLAGKTRVIAATSAFGLGIDKPDIRGVIHYCFPGSLEDYYQGVGRAGRDGRPARCLLIFSDCDDALHEWLMNSVLPTADLLQQVYGVLPEEGWLDRDEIGERLNRSPDLVEEAVWQLALLGCLAVEDVVGGRAWARRLPLPLESVMARYLAHTEELRKARRSKLAAVRAYAHAASCRRAKLLEYLGEAVGEARERCCDVCEGAPAPLNPLDQAIVDCICNLAIRVGRTTIAGILRGSRSKKVQRLGGDRIPQYAQWRGRGEEEVLQRIESLITGGVVKATIGPRAVLSVDRELGATPAHRASTGPAVGLGRAFLERAEATRIQLGGYAGWALTSYFMGSGSQKTAVGDHLRAFKYQQDRDRGPVLAEKLLAMIRSREEFAGAEALVPMPRTTTARRYDPSVELARDIGAQGGPPVLLGVLSRSQETRSQKDLHTLEGRRQNVAGAFSVAEPERVVGRKLILLDDFVDSGATMEAAAEALTLAGAGEVVLLAVARTNRRWSSQ
jgi:ATP-dependent DNA helicase RecQ